MTGNLTTIAYIISTVIGMDCATQNIAWTKGAPYYRSIHQTFWD